MINVSDHNTGVVIEGYQVTLRPVDVHDLVQLRQWRNQSSIRQQMLSDQEITQEQQQAWFAKMSSDPRQLHWVIEYRGKPIGSTNVKATHIGQQVTTATVLEPGLYIGDTAYQGNMIAFAPTLAMYDYCFDYLAVEQFSAVVKRTNQAAINYNVKLGYQIVESGDLVSLQLQRDAYETQTKQIKQLLSRPRRK